MSECQRKICGPGIERYETQFAGAVLRDGVQQCGKSADKGIKQTEILFCETAKPENSQAEKRAFSGFSFAPVIAKTITNGIDNLSSWSDRADALHAGKIDGASELIELAMSAKEKGVDLKAAALGQRDGNVIVVNSEIQDPSGMKERPLRFHPPSHPTTFCCRMSWRKQVLRWRSISPTAW